MDKASWDTVDSEDTAIQSHLARYRQHTVRGWTAVSALVGLSIAGYLGLFLALDTYFKGSF